VAHTNTKRNLRLEQPGRVPILPTSFVLEFRWGGLRDSQPDGGQPVIMQILQEIYLNPMNVTMQL